MNGTKTRAKSAAILLLIIIPFFFVIYFAQTSGKVIGTTFFMFFSTYACFEIIRHNRLHIASNIIIALSSILIWLFPLDMFLSNTNIYNDATGWDNQLLTTYIFNYVFGIDSFKPIQFLGYSLVFITITAIMLVEFRNFKNAKEFLKYYFITFFVVLYMPIISKLLLFNNIANLFYLFAIFLIPMVIDTTGYFIGKKYGHVWFKRKFAPHISPKKTWEGAIASYLFGVLFTFLLFCLAGLINSESNFSYFSKPIQMAIATILLPALSIFGDLLFSLLKRLMLIKDFSDLIPGHGGIMDRFDSISLVALFASVFLLIQV
ncbi:phosphatidate cytidylyltransferase [[Mycoplasma] anseris]|uniref:Phosphatidate cytidylyltransferase n=1 Tax=[Mycoplasma] anseris TaxID=92400 RepID=A0A2Z4ND48_9BACT|nr:phosphatidate cytidylyltransferase [[Mycoplasma] anseris]AWX69437.1 phosphatidate cytidylyltransferase [[Mycoplasma] anseris]